MGNKEQREFLASLRRVQINQLCLEMQTIISNFKLFLAEAHGYTDEEISKILRGTKYEDLETTVDTARPMKGTKKPKAQKKPDTKLQRIPKPKFDFTARSEEDLERLKREDEMIRRSMMFELEWCVANIEQGTKPYID